MQPGYNDRNTMRDQQQNMYSNRQPSAPPQQQVQAPSAFIQQHRQFRVQQYPQQEQQRSSGFGAQTQQYVPSRQQQQMHYLQQAQLQQGYYSGSSYPVYRGAEAKPPPTTSSTWDNLKKVEQQSHQKNAWGSANQQNRLHLQQRHSQHQMQIQRQQLRQQPAPQYHNVWKQRAALSSAHSASASASPWHQNQRTVHKKQDQVTQMQNKGNRQKKNKQYRKQHPQKTQRRVQTGKGQSRSDAKRLQLTHSWATQRPFPYDAREQYEAELKKIYMEDLEKLKTYENARRNLNKTKQAQPQNATLTASHDKSSSTKNNIAINRKTAFSHPMAMRTTPISKRNINNDISKESLSDSSRTISSSPDKSVSLSTNDKKEIMVGSNSERSSVSTLGGRPVEQNDYPTSLGSRSIPLSKSAVMKARGAVGMSGRLTPGAEHRPYTHKNAVGASSLSGRRTPGARGNSGEFETKNDEPVLFVPAQNTFTSQQQEIRLSISNNRTPSPFEPHMSYSSACLHDVIAKIQNLGSTGYDSAVPFGVHPNSSSQQQVQTRRKQKFSNKSNEISKEFFKKLREHGKKSLEEARAFAMEFIHENASKKAFSRSDDSKIYKELADIAKRHHRYDDAREWFSYFNKQQPTVPAGWLDYARMEEECGEEARCGQLLQEGLRNCAPQDHEQLLIQALKHEERCKNILGVRMLLADLRSVNIQRSWKVLQEGALLEGRCGNVEEARKLFHFILSSPGVRVGPAFCEATEFEERIGEENNSVQLVTDGLRRAPKYGPLWFASFRIYERSEAGSGKWPACVELTRTRAAFEDALRLLPSELHWKVHFIATQAEERAAAAAKMYSDKKNKVLPKAEIILENSPNILTPDEAYRFCMKRSRERLVKCIMVCNEKLKWKPRLAGARMNLRAGNNAEARKLLVHALREAAPKNKAQVLVEFARLEEIEGNIEEAKQLLKPERLSTASSSILNNKEKALDKKSSRSRLEGRWRLVRAAAALHLRLNQRSEAIHVVVNALRDEGGNGRLWALLVQLVQPRGFELQVFRLALRKAPKSGEVWCEGARLHLNPLSRHFHLQRAREYVDFALRFTPQYGDSFLEGMRLCILAGAEKLELDRWTVDELRQIDCSDIELRCIHANPNYGKLWFFCKEHPYTTAYKILQKAKSILISEICESKQEYKWALTNSGENSSSTTEGSDSNVTSSNSSGKTLFATPVHRSTSGGLEATFTPLAAYSPVAAATLPLAVAAAHSVLASPTPIISAGAYGEYSSTVSNTLHRLTHSSATAWQGESVSGNEVEMPRKYSDEKAPNYTVPALPMQTKTSSVTGAAAAAAAAAASAADAEVAATMTGKDKGITEDPLFEPDVENKRRAGAKTLNGLSYILRLVDAANTDGNGEGTRHASPTATNQNTELYSTAFQCLNRDAQNPGKITTQLKALFEADPIVP